MAMQFDYTELSAKYNTLERKYDILKTENKEYQSQIEELQQHKDALMREVATYQMEDEYDYTYLTPAMSMGLSSNRTNCTMSTNNGCNQIKALQSEITALKEMNQKLTILLDASNEQKRVLNERCDNLMNVHNEKVQSMEETINSLENELDLVKNGILLKADISIMEETDNHSLSSDSLSTLHCNYEDRLRQLEMENTKLVRRLDMVRNDEFGIKGCGSVSCVDEFEDVSLNGDTDVVDENELNDLEQLFRDCDAEIVEHEMRKEEQHNIWAGRNMYRFLMFKPYKY